MTPAIGGRRIRHLVLLLPMIATPVFGALADPAKPNPPAGPAVGHDLVPYDLRRPGMVFVPPGSFRMGADPGSACAEPDERLHTVRLTRGIYVSVFEVTQGEFEAVMGYNPSYFADCGEDCPVEWVSWFEAIEYCNARSIEEGLDPCYTIDSTDVRWNRDASGYRLPTESEWEYFCRAGTQSDHYLGDLTDCYEDPVVEAAAWYYGNADIRTHPVGLLEPNAWGLFDVTGNVWEWCWDWSGPYDSGVTVDPEGPAVGEEKIRRGGAWNVLARHTRSANRYRVIPELRRSNTGFRVVRNYR